MAFWLWNVPLSSALIAQRHAGFSTFFKQIQLSDPFDEY